LEPRNYLERTHQPAFLGVGVVIASFDFQFLHAPFSDTLAEKTKQAYTIGATTIAPGKGTAFAGNWF
jgi:hypothetical protein